MPFPEGYWTPKRRKEKSDLLKNQYKNSPKFIEAHNKSASARMTARNYEAWKDPAWAERQNIRRAIILKDLWSRPEFIKMHSDLFKELWEDPEYSKKQRQIISEARTEYCSNYGPYRIKGYVKTQKSLITEIPYRSQGERHIIEFLNSEPSVLFFQSPYQIKYPVADGTRKAFPDFLIFLEDGRRLLLEVKGKSYLEAFLSSEKYAAAINWSKENDLDYTIVSADKLSKNERGRNLCLSDLRAFCSNTQINFA